jgi:hypothetical protein
MPGHLPLSQSHSSFDASKGAFSTIDDRRLEWQMGCPLQTAEWDDGAKKMIVNGVLIQTALSFRELLGSRAIDAKLGFAVLIELLDFDPPR